MTDETTSSYEPESDSMQLSDSYSEKSSSSEKQTPFQYTKELQMNLQFKSEILANEDNYQNMNAKDADMYNNIAIKNEKLIQRLSLFNKTNFEELPSGVYETRNKLLLDNLNCHGCNQLAFRPIIFTSCGHQFCPHCIIQMFVNYKHNKQQDIAIPQLKDLLQKDKLQKFQIPCPACLQDGKQETQHVHYNQCINKILHQYWRSTPVDDPIILMDVKCIWCDKTEEKRIAQKQKDEDAIKQTAQQLQHYCGYCGRYLCAKCSIKDPYYDYLGHNFLRRVVDITSDEIEMLLEEQSMVSTMNDVELKFLLSCKNIKEIWNEFRDQLTKEYMLPIRLRTGAGRCIDSDTSICGRCIHLVFNIACHYVRATLDNEKPLCLCGSGCFLQFTDDEHQEAVQHKGKGTRGDQFWFNIFY